MPIISMVSPDKLYYNFMNNNIEEKKVLSAYHEIAFSFLNRRDSWFSILCLDSL